MKKLKLYFLDEKYINYLNKFDSKVAYNKNQTRPYLGIVYDYNGIKYFAPLSSPKPKHLTMNSNNIDIYKIDNGKLGIINFNNMIPVPYKCLIDCFSATNDTTYKNLLNKQIAYINRDKSYIITKATRFQNLYSNNQLPNNILKRTCDFKLLEQKCIEWQQNLHKSSINKSKSNSYTR